MKLYKAVSAQDELPEDGIYHVISKPGRDGSRYYESNLFENGKWDLIGFEIEYWLKHTTLAEIIKDRITEEEIVPTLDKADELWPKTDYAVFAAEQEINPINGGDAAAFFIEGAQYAYRLIMDKLTNKE